MPNEATAYCRFCEILRTGVLQQGQVGEKYDQGMRHNNCSLRKAGEAGSMLGRASHE